MIAEAAAQTHTSQAGGLFMLGWGLFASAFGLAMVTNFPGIRRNLRTPGRRVLGRTAEAAALDVAAAPE